MVLSFIAAYNAWIKISCSYDKLEVQSWNISKVMSKMLLSEWCYNFSLFILNKSHCGTLCEFFFIMINDDENNKGDDAIISLSSS